MHVYYLYLLLKTAIFKSIRKNTFVLKCVVMYMFLSKTFTYCLIRKNIYEIENFVHKKLKVIFYGTKHKRTKIIFMR